MAVFRINLIRNRPVPLPQRAVVALPLFCGLFVVGVMLAWSINHAVWSVLATRQHKQQAATAYASFKQQHPGQTDLALYRAVLQQQLEKCSTTLSVAEQLLSRRTPAAVVLYTLTAILPRQVRVTNVDMAPADHTLRLELAIPVETDGRPSTTVQPLTLWRTAPDVQRLISDIHEESSRQADYEGHPAFFVRYSATTRGGG